MKCPACSSENSKVIDKRDTSDFRIRRRRECLSCKKRFTTFEDIQFEEVVVIKKDGRREIFDKNKLYIGISRSCQKRPVSREKIDNIVDEVEQILRKNPKNEVPTKKIGELVMSRLKKEDEIAYIRFASVYKSFTDLESFEQALKVLKTKKKKKR
jgi:transcriptional repressor NrdR